VAATAVTKPAWLEFSGYTTTRPESPYFVVDTAKIVRGILAYLRPFGSRSIAGAKRKFSIRSYCGPTSKSTNVFGMACGRGRGLSGVGCPAALKSAVSVNT